MHGFPPYMRILFCFFNFIFIFLKKSPLHNEFLFAHNKNSRRKNSEK